MGKQIYLSVLVVVLAACSSETDRVNVSGVQSSFCVPKVGHMAPTPSFLPEDDPKELRGFSFGGCHRLSKQLQQQCLLPANFISADVEPLEKRVNIFWKDLKDAALFQAMVADSTAEYRLDEVTKMVIVRNSRVSPQWTIWSPNGAKDGTSTALQDDDELFAMCSRIEDFPRSAGLEAPGKFGCERYVKGAQFAIRYRFVSDKDVFSQAQVKSLEESLFAQLEQWRCPR